ncbi:hypothetical protein J4204_02435 [Candidatus Woesearchaeota archaeon]|nr:hypothetical protein [Candidatus Woesearchaeota archaeon]
MDDKTQKERLEQELRFLKESFEAEVIIKEEFDKGRDRIERKLREIVKSEKEPLKPVESQEKPKESKEQPKEDAAIASKSEEKIKLKVIQDEIVEEHPAPKPVEKEPFAEPVVYEENKEDGKGGKFFKYAFVFVVLILIAFFSYSYFKDKAAPQEKTNDVKIPESEPVQKTNVIVLNGGKSCFNCGTKRVLGILEGWFGKISAKEIDYSTNDGKAIAEKFSISLLPAYILDENIAKNSAYEKFKQAFSKRNDSYILSDDAAGATFYFRRENIPNRLDLLVKENDASSANAEKNLKEFLQAFKEAKFEKHLSNGALAKELQIKSFPTFLINNRIKFTGVHSAETIKDNFCKLNKLPECEKSLSKSLV